MEIDEVDEFNKKYLPELDYIFDEYVVTNPEKNIKNEVSNSDSYLEQKKENVLKLATPGLYYGLPIEIPQVFITRFNQQQKVNNMKFVDIRNNYNDSFIVRIMRRTNDSFANSIILKNTVLSTTFKKWLLVSPQTYQLIPYSFILQFNIYGQTFNLTLKKHHMLLMILLLLMKRILEYHY